MANTYVLSIPHKSTVKLFKTDPLRAVLKLPKYHKKSAGRHEFSRCIVNCVGKIRLSLLSGPQQSSKFQFDHKSHFYATPRYESGTKSCLLYTSPSPRD